MDLFNLWNNSSNNQVFYYNGSWQTWQKPRNCTFINISLLGGGGGGSGGITGAQNTTRYGGAGGGSSAFTRGLFPACFVPDLLYIYVGLGGSGTGPSVSGNTGELSYVSILPNSTNGNVVIQSGAAAATGGSADGTTGGVAGTVMNRANVVLSNLGTVYSINGGTGGAGGNGAIGTSITTTIPAIAGAGGGGATNANSFAGGQITAGGVFQNLLGSAGGAAGNASNGYFGNIPFSSSSVRLPLIFFGGSGGGSIRNGQGNRGGNGSYGGGGGGGGAGTTGGNGGDGGNGLVIITSW